MAEIQKNLRTTVSDVNSLSEAMKGLQSVASSLFGMLGSLSDGLGSKVAQQNSRIEYMTPQGVSAQEVYTQHLASQAEANFKKATATINPDVMVGSNNNLVFKPGRGILVAPGMGLHTISLDDQKRKQQFLSKASEYVSGMDPEYLAASIKDDLGIAVEKREAAQPTRTVASSASEYVSGMDPEYLAASIKDDLGIAVEKRKAAQPTRTVASSHDFSGIGYGITDLVKVRGATSSILGEGGSKIESAIKAFASKNDNVSTILGNHLKTLQLAIAQNTEKLDEATKNYQEVSQSETASESEKTNAMRNLVNAIGRLDQTQTQAKEIIKQSGGDGGGTNKDDSPAKAAVLNRMLGLATAGVVVAGSAVQAGFSTYTAMGSATIDKQIAADQAKADIIQRYAQQVLDANDMTNPENILKYRANLLQPSREFTNIGTRGYQNALDLANRDVQENIDLKEKDRLGHIFGSIGNVAEGVLKTAGATAIGAVVGNVPGALAGLGLGAASVINSASSGISDYIKNPYTALTGGLGSGLTGAAGELMYGPDWQRRAAMAQKAAQGGIVSDLQQRADQYMEAEVKKNPYTLLALKEFQAMMQAQTQGVEMVGGRYAASAQSELMSLNKYGSKSFQDIQQAKAERGSREDILNKARANNDPNVAKLEALEVKISKLNDLEAKDSNYRDFAKYSAMANDPRTKKDGLDGLSAVSRRVFSDAQMDAYDRIYKQQRLLTMERGQVAGVLSKEYDVPTEVSRLSTAYSKFGLSEAEGMSRKNRITSVLGFDKIANSEDFTQMSMLSLSGYGNFDQQLQNLAKLNATTGNQNNIKMLTSMFSDAVSAGFDKSRASRFVNIAADLMEASKATTGLTSGLLSNLSLAAGGGKGNDLDLQAAARGIQGLSGYSGRLSGLPGMVKAAAASAAGFDLNSGFAAVADTNIIQRMDMIKQLETGQNMSPETRRLLAAGGGDKKTLIERLKSMNLSETGSLMSAIEGGGLGTTSKAWAERLKNEKDPKKRQALLQEFVNRSGAIGAGLDMGADSASAAAMVYASGLKDDAGKDLFSSGDIERLDKDLKLGKAKGVDPAIRNRREFLNKVLADFTTTVERVTPTSKVYSDFLDAGGNAFSISEQAAKAAGKESLKGTRITQKAIAQAQKDGDTSFLQAAEESMKDINTLTLARNMSLNTEIMESKIQSVRIENWADMRIWLDADKKELVPKDIRSKP
jgi:hypothetical protein